MPTVLDWEAVLTEAHEAARMAGKAWEIEGNHWYPCGFAWVTIPGRSSLANHCRRKHAEGQSHAYMRWGNEAERGWQWWCPGQGASQSMVKAERCARAFAVVLAKHGIDARMRSRLD